MEKRLSGSMKRLTRRVTDLRRQSYTSHKVSIATMAEQEEDFSSLPLPDRFQHKVISPYVSG